MIDIQQYRGAKTAVRCRTQKEADEIGVVLRVIGKNWHSHYWSTYKENTCLCFNDVGEFCNEEYFVRNKYTILEFSDVIGPTQNIFN